MLHTCAACCSYSTLKLRVPSPSRSSPSPPFVCKIAWANVKPCHNVLKSEINFVQCLKSRLGFIRRCNFIPIKTDEFRGGGGSINETILTNCSCKAN